MKKSEKQLINQLINHGHTFKSDFKNVAKGDWVNKAMQDLDKLGNELKKNNELVELSHTFSNKQRTKKSI
ncbi:TPA: hypothetical protein ACHHOD_002765 [Staphylococcus aureus]